MENYNKNYAKPLKRLISICKRGYNIYLNAARYTQNTSCSSVFKHYAKQRQNFIEELNQRLYAMGVSPTDIEKGDENLNSKFQQFWMKFKQSIIGTGNNDKDILLTIRNSERKALDSYDDVLQGDILETDLKPILVKQRTEISMAFQQINKLYLELFPPAHNEL